MCRRKSILIKRFFLKSKERLARKSKGFLTILLSYNEHKPIKWKKERIEGSLMSLPISEVSILFLLYYFVFIVSHYVSFNNPINPLSLLQSNLI
jgi:hypothetical protein